MSRRSLKQNLEAGILTPRNIAKLCNVSTPTVLKWVDKGFFPTSFLIPGTNEHKVSAPCVVEFLEKQGMPVPKELNAACDAFKSKYNDDFSLKSFPDEIEEETPDTPSSQTSLTDPV